MDSLKRVLLGILLVLASYLSVGYFLHLIVFPEARPDIETYFEPGDVIDSEAGGTTLTVERQEGDHLILTLEVAPHSEGPPLHIHTGWEETFIIESGKINLHVNGEEKVLEAGERFTVLPGTPHRPYNSFDEPAVISGVAMPAQFVVYLNQAYGFLEEDPDNATPPEIIFQMAMFNPYFDSYLGEGPPVMVQKVQNFLLVPLARLMGYKSYYEKYKL
ncbi:cupin domain-containing protein [Halalkalibaculum sp. DA3122]|uniref:cupin domain-containing protein n=1 Tax=unclassified Halalkalibaculum TaxID=2964617 RepID=UPI003753FD60